MPYCLVYRSNCPRRVNTHSGHESSPDAIVLRTIPRESHPPSHRPSLPQHPSPLPSCLPRRHLVPVLQPSVIAAMCVCVRAHARVCVCVCQHYQTRVTQGATPVSSRVPILDGFPYLIISRHSSLCLLYCLRFPRTAHL